MKSPRVALLLVALIVSATAGCSNSPLSRIDRDRAKYESWPVEVKEAILAGEARKGMTPEQVEMALGKPTQIVSRSATGDDEVWIYRKSSVGSSLLNSTGVSVGGGVGGVSVGTGMGGGGRRQTPEEREVVFSKGVVVRSD